MYSAIATLRFSVPRTAARAAASRSLHSTPVASKTVTEKVSEAAETANKKIGKGLAGAIEKGENVTQSTKETLHSTAGSTKEAADTANKKAGQGLASGIEKGESATETAKHKANQASAGAKEAKEDFTKEVKK